MKKNIVLFRIYQVVLLALYIFLMVFFIVKCLENGEKSTESSQVVVDVSAEVINTVRPSNPVNPESPSFQTMIRKLIGHYGFFTLLGLVSTLLYLSLPKPKHYIRIAISYVVGFSFAIISEFLLEGNTSGRGPSWSDVGIDSLGFITLSIIVVAIYYILLLKKGMKDNAKEN